MPQNKSDLIAAVADKARIREGLAEDLVNVIFTCLIDALSRGEGIEIRGFGSFSVREYRAYVGRNPRTGIVVQVKAKRLPFFKVGKELRKRIDTRALSARPTQRQSIA